MVNILPSFAEQMHHSIISSSSFWTQPLKRETWNNLAPIFRTTPIFRTHGNVCPRSWIETLLDTNRDARVQAVCGYSIMIANDMQNDANKYVGGVSQSGSRCSVCLNRQTSASHNVRTRAYFAERVDSMLTKCWQTQLMFASGEVVLNKPTGRSVDAFCPPSPL